MGFLDQSWPLALDGNPKVMRDEQWRWHGEPRVDAPFLTLLIDYRPETYWSLEVALPTPPGQDRDSLSRETRVYGAANHSADSLQMALMPP